MIEKFWETYFSQVISFTRILAALNHSLIFEGCPFKRCYRNVFLARTSYGDWLKYNQYNINIIYNKYNLNIIWLKCWLSEEYYSMLEPRINNKKFSKVKKAFFIGAVDPSAIFSNHRIHHGINLRAFLPPPLMTITFQ